METRGGSKSRHPEQWEGKAVGWDEIYLGEHRQRTENRNWNLQWCLEVSARNCPCRYPCGPCNDNELHGKPWTIWQDNAVAGTWMGEKNPSSVVQETIHCCGHMTDKTCELQLFSGHTQSWWAMTKCPGAQESTRPVNSKELLGCHRRHTQSFLRSSCLVWDAL